MAKIIPAIAQHSLGRVDTNVTTAFLPATAYFAYDANGNLTSDGWRSFDYDDENQLIRITRTNEWKSEFVYDGKLRRRLRIEANLAFSPMLRLTGKSRFWQSRFHAVVQARSWPMAGGGTVRGRSNRMSPFPDLALRTQEWKGGFAVQPASSRTVHQRRAHAKAVRSAG